MTAFHRLYFALAAELPYSLVELSIGISDLLLVPVLQLLLS